jgi:hypothetical protein
MGVNVDANLGVDVDVGKGERDELNTHPQPRLVWVRLWIWSID